jgi:hypothetical protein
MACPKCVGFAGRLNITSLREYQDIVRQLIQIASEGTFLRVGASCPLQDLFQTAMRQPCERRRTRVRQCAAQPSIRASRGPESI